MLCSAPALAEATPTPEPSAPASTGITDQLQEEKLRQEIRQLRLDNDRKESPLGLWLEVGPLITVLVGVVALGGTLYKQSRDLASARRMSEQQAAQWVAQFAEQQRVDVQKSEQWRQDFLRLQEDSQAEREKERLRRFDQTLAEVVTNIGSTSQAVRLNASAALGIFIKQEYAALHCDLLNVIVANLKAEPERAVADLLRGHLAKVLQLLFAAGRELDSNVGDRVDLTGIDLYRVDLHGLNLRGTVILDLAFSKLRHANFREAILFRARALEATLDGAFFTRAKLEEARFNKVTTTDKPVHFHGTRLISATFDDAVLPGAEFQQAQLQGAHFRRTTLTGARFEQANLADARFDGAVFDSAAIRSIALHAYNWSQAFFDSPVRKQLEAISTASTRAP